MAKSLKIKLIRGRAGKTKRQLANLDALGLKRKDREVIKPNTPDYLGMINKVKHLITVEEIEE